MAKVIPIVRIVDDDETFCMSQKMFLQAMGWFVLIYNSAKTFLEDDDPSQPGCLILDMRMPEMTGLELQTALCPAHALAGHREDLQQDWDVIVIGTGMAGLTAAVSAREAGAVRVLLLEKGPLVGGHTLYAAGSVAVLSPRRPSTGSRGSVSS